MIKDVAVWCLIALMVAVTVVFIVAIGVAVITTIRSRGQK